MSFTFKPLKAIQPGERVSLTDALAAQSTQPKGDEAEQQLVPLLEQLEELQTALYAESTRALLVVLQGRDASGKDGLVRKVFGPLNSQGCVVHSFKRPTDIELAHDFLWRVHQVVPPRGSIGIFNRSHYEDVLAVRVHKLVPRDVWSLRYEQINQFEKMLTDNGVTILKFMLHVSKAEQKHRLIERLKDPTKNWKFQIGDLDERKLWDDYTTAYEDVLERTSTRWAPWYVVPADHKRQRDLFVAHTVVGALEHMAPVFPNIDPDVRATAQKWEREEN